MFNNFMYAMSTEGYGCWTYALMSRNKVLLLNHHVKKESTVMKRKPRLHDGTGTVDLDKNRLAQIPPSRD